MEWWYYLLAVLFLPWAALEIWQRYLAIMALKSARDAGRLSRDGYMLGVIVLVPAYLIDVVGNVVLGTVLFFDLPRELLITARLQRYVDGAPGWRQRAARWIARHMLNPFDSEHIKRMD